MSLAPSLQMLLRCDTSDCHSDVVSGEGVESIIAMARAIGWIVREDGTSAGCPNHAIMTATEVERRRGF